MAFKEKVLEEFKTFLPEKAILLNEEATSRTAGGLHTEEPIHAELILRPKTTEEVSKILTICNKHDQPIVVHGGVTGLVYGTRTSVNQIILSLERMKEIEKSIACVRVCGWLWRFAFLHN